MTFIKYPILLLFSFCLLCIIPWNMAVAQGQPKLSTIKIKDVLNKIEKSFQINFIYESSLLTGKIVTVDSKVQQDKKLESVLSALFEPLSIGYYRLDNTNYALFKLVVDRQKSEAIDPSIPSSAVENDAPMIRGLIFDQLNQPLEYCTVSLLGKDSVRIANTIADSLGSYKFKNISAGNYIVQVTRIGYQLGNSVPFHFVAEHNLVLRDLILVEVPKHLAQVSIRADKPLFEYKADKTIVNLEGAFPGTSTSISDLLEISPGVTIDNDQISLKGKRGATITIDGRPIKLSSSQITSLLRGMPASSVSQIELIHSPSARYDAQGRGGVINIKMTKSEATGLNGTINSLFSVGSNPRFTESAVVNYGARRINLSANYSYQHFKSSNEFFRKNVINKSTPISYHLNETGRSRSLTHSAMLAADYQINHKNTVAIMGTANIGNNSSDFTRHLNLNSRENSLLDSSITSLNKGSQYLNTYGLNLNSHHIFGPDAHTLLLNADYTKYRSNSPDGYQNVYLGLSGQQNRPEENIASNAHIDLELFTAGADYSYPIGKLHQLEAGAKIAFTHSNSKILFQYGSPVALMLTDFNRTNSFEYSEKISAAYLDYQGKFGLSTTIKAGIRAENTNYTSASISGDQSISRNYIQFFPNFMLSHGAGSHLFALSYHRRVGRPNYQDLNPFITYFSPYFYTMGNQFLRPESTHAMEIDYSYGSTLHFSFNYSYIDDYLGSIISLDGGSLSTKQTIGNFGNYKAFSLSAVYQKTLLKCWSVNTRASLLHDQYQSEYLGSTIGNGLLGFDFNILNSFKLSPKLSFEVLNLYQSKRAQLTGIKFGRYRADASLKYSVLNSKASLRLAVEDIFYSNFDQGSSHFLQLYSTYYSRNENRRFHLGLSYSFGTKDVKTNKTEHNRQELDRIKQQK